MATFGQGINPQLGAIDYSPILRGSMAGAEMAAKGSQMIGQGLANLGEEVGKGVAAYYKKKEIKKLEDDGVAFVQKIGARSPYILKAVGLNDINDTGAIKAGLKASGGVANFLSMAQAVKSELDKTQAADIAMRYGASGGASSYMGADGETLGSPEANMMAQNQYMAQTTERLKQDESRAKAILDRANAKRLETPTPAKPGKVVDPFAIRSTDASGNPIDVIVDRFTGTEISRGPIAIPPRPILTPDEQVDVAQRTAEVQGAAASANKTLDGLSVSALSADTELTKYSEIENLLNQNVETGFAQDYLTATRSLGQRAGFNDKDLANQQKLEALLSEDALLQTRNFLQGQGAVSDAERARIDKAALNSKKDKNALRELLGYRKAAAIRALAAQELRITLEDSGMGGTKIVRELNKWYRDNPFSAFVPAGGSHDFSAGNAVLNK